MKNIVGLLCLLLFCSCATIFNGKTTKVNIYVPKNTNIVFNDTLVNISNGKATLFPKRSKDSLRLTIYNDSISNNFAFSKRISSTYFFNILLPYFFGTGYIFDLTNPRRFTYNRNIQFQLDTINKRFVSPQKEAIRFKKNNFFIYTTPLKAIDFFSQPMLTLGAEYFIFDDLSFSAEYGTVYTDRLGNGKNPRNRIVDDKGRAFRYELKWYNILGKSSNPRINNYLGFETRFLRYQFNDDISFIRRLDDVSFNINETYVVQQAVNIFNIKYGINYPIGKRLFIDLYFGFGLRLTEFKNPSINYNPITDVITSEENGIFDFGRNSFLENVNDENHFNFTLGFKFGCKF